MLGCQGCFACGRPMMFFTVCRSHRSRCMTRNFFIQREATQPCSFTRRTSIIAVCKHAYARLHRLNAILIADVRIYASLSMQQIRCTLLLSLCQHICMRQPSTHTLHSIMASDENNIQSHSLYPAERIRVEHCYLRPACSCAHAHAIES